MKNLIVTLISDQPTPNVQFIKDKQNEESFFLFVSTNKMEEKGVRCWIQNVCEITEERSITKIIDQFSPIDIENKLNEIDYNEYEKIIVNVTGGTKIMSHFVTEFYKEKPDAEIYYLTGINNNILQVFPKTKQAKKKMSCVLTLMDYIKSHGFEMIESHLSDVDPAYTPEFLNHFLKFSENERGILNKLRDWRGRKAKQFNINQIGGLLDLLCTIKFPTRDEYITINRSEVKFLTGEWFEEYIYHRLKQELGLSDDYIKTGVTLTKENTPNEFDVIFFWEGKLYTIECKTSIKTNEQNLLNETIYKATALQKNLGLYSCFSIFTLSAKADNEIKTTHLNRGRLFNIDVFGREDIAKCQSIAGLLKLQTC